MGRLDGKVVVVTGAGRGLGRAHALAAANEGAKVVVNDLGGEVTGGGGSRTPADEVVQMIEAAGGSAMANYHDVATEAPQIIAAAINSFGRIDGLVCNAGVHVIASFGQLTDAQVNLMLGVHLMGSINTARAAWPYMEAQGSGRIVNTSSAAIFGTAGAPMYQVCKSAIFALTRAQAADGAAVGIKANTILPMGYSRMAESQPGLGEFMKQHLPAEHVARFVTALLTDEVPCTGEAFSVGGGRAGWVFLGAAPGLKEIRSVDDVFAGFDQIMSREGAVFPEDLNLEMQWEYEQLGLDMSAAGIDTSELK